MTCRISGRRCECGASGRVTNEAEVMEINGEPCPTCGRVGYGKFKNATSENVVGLILAMILWLGASPSEDQAQAVKKLEEAAKCLETDQTR